MTFLSEQWQNFSAPYRATWNDLASARNISPFNAFQGHNLTRYRNFLAPSVTWPTAETGAKAFGGGWDVRGGIRQIEVDLIVNVLNDQWGYNLYHVTASDLQPTWSDLFGVLPSLGVGTFTFYWPQKTPGTYWITFSAFTTAGRSFLPTAGWKSAVVTG